MVHYPVSYTRYLLLGVHYSRCHDFRQSFTLMRKPFYTSDDEYPVHVTPADTLQYRQLSFHPSRSKRLKE